MRDQLLDDAVANKKKLYARIKEVRELINTTSNPDERRRQTERLRILRDMYRDACEQVESMRPSTEKKTKTPKRITVHTGSIGFDFFERCGSVWSDLDGQTWSTLTEITKVGSAKEATFILSALQSAMKILTPIQLECILNYYQKGLTMQEIADNRNVSISAISRTIKRGLTRLESYIIASMQVRECLSENGFDFIMFAQNTDVLTERQREYLYFLLTDGTSLREIAKFLDLDHSTISRGNQRIEWNLSAITAKLPDMPSSRRINKSEWISKSEGEVAASLGISPAVYYRNICRNQIVGGIPRLAYEILRLRNLPAQKAANIIGVSPATIKRYWKKYADVDVISITPPDTYIPAPHPKAKPNFHRMLSDDTGITIGDIVDGYTYQRMMEVSHAGP